MFFGIEWCGLIIFGLWCYLIFGLGMKNVVGLGVWGVLGGFRLGFVEMIIFFEVLWRDLVKLDIFVEKFW